MTLDVLDLAALRRWLVTARAELATHVEAINGLNVFPIPDGDTGTNMLTTLDDALREVSAQRLQSLPESAAALSRATLTAARGNSGVILSQLIRGVTEVVQESAEQRLTADGLRRALTRASELARAGVTKPVDGTVLSVADAAAHAASRSTGSNLGGAIDAAVSAARAALVATKDQLDELRQADVVDAGGAGYVVLLEALQRVVQGRRSSDSPWLRRPPAARDAPGPAAPAGPAYEVMYLLDDTGVDRIARLTRELDTLGDSVVVAGGPPLWSVHVHVDDVAAALNAGVRAGRPHQFAVTRFDDGEPVRRPAAGLGVLAVVDGLAEVIAHSAGGPVTVVDLAVADTQAVAQALTALAGADGVIALADSDHAARIAGDASRAADLTVRVLGRHPVQVLAGLSVLDRNQSLAAANQQLGEVIAAVSTSTFAAAAAPEDVAAVVRTQLDDGDGEVITVLTGAACPPVLLDAVRRVADSADVETSVLSTQATGWALAVGVE